MPDLVFTSAESVEQASSSVTGKYKAGLIRGGSVIDMTGGLGIDAYFISKVAEEVIYIEKNRDQVNTARLNFQKLGVTNISVINQDSTTFIKEFSGKVNTIYIDPSRRINSRRVFKLEDSEPDITGIFDILLEKAERVIIKLSPLIDIKYLLDRFRHLVQVHVVSVSNECKEIIMVAEKTGSVEGPEIIASDSVDGRVITFRSDPGEESRECGLGWPEKFIYDPNTAIRKAGLFNSAGRQFDLVKLAKNSHLYTGATLIDHFPGRRFEILGIYGFGEFLKLKFSGKANIAIRNFPLSVEELRKRTGIGEGGDHYIFATSDLTGQPVILLTVKI